MSPIPDSVQFITPDAPIEDLKAAGSRVEFPASLFPHQWNRERKIIITENDDALVVTAQRRRTEIQELATE